MRSYSRCAASGPRAARSCRSSLVMPRSWAMRPSSWRSMEPSSPLVRHQSRTRPSRFSIAFGADIGMPPLVDGFGCVGELVNFSVWGDLHPRHPLLPGSGGTTGAPRQKSGGEVRGPAARSQSRHRCASGQPMHWVRASSHAMPCSMRTAFPASAPTRSIISSISLAWLRTRSNIGQWRQVRPTCCPSLREMRFEKAAVGRGWAD